MLFLHLCCAYAGRSPWAHFQELGSDVVIHEAQSDCSLVGPGQRRRPQLLNHSRQQQVAATLQHLRRCGDIVDGRLWGSQHVQGVTSVSEAVAIKSAPRFPIWTSDHGIPDIRQTCRDMGEVGTVRGFEQCSLTIMKPHPFLR